MLNTKKCIKDVSEDLLNYSYKEEYEKILSDLKEDLKCEKNPTERFSTRILILLFCIRTKRAIRIMGDILISVIALYVFFKTIVVFQNPIMGAGVYVFIHTIWLLLEGYYEVSMAEISETSLLIFIEAIVLCKTVTCVSIWVFLGGYFIVHMLCVVLKEIAFFI